MRLARVQALLRSYQQALAGILHRTVLHAGLAGMRALANALPVLPEASAVRHILRAYVPRLTRLEPAEVKAFAALFPASYRDELRHLAPRLAPHLPPAEPAAPKVEPKLALVEAAAAALRQKGVLTKPEYDRLDAQARQQAFTVAGQTTRAAVQKIHDLLAEQISQGPEQRGFVKKWTAALGESPLGQAHMETVFRDTVQKHYAEGMDKMAAHPLVQELFPFVANEAIFDARLSELCRVISRSGLDGSNVYHRDDPVWKKYQNPRHIRCRCGRRYLTIEQAAALGVKAAQRWLKTGRPPAVPPFVPEPKLPPGSERARQALGTV